MPAADTHLRTTATSRVLAAARPPRWAREGTRIAITYGTFDLFHIGHVRLFERIRAQCDRLVVGVSTDQFNARKGKRCVIPFEQRLEIVRACRHVDDVFAEHCWEQKAEDIRRFNAALFVMGDDWRGRFDHLSQLCEVVYLPRTPTVSSTAIRQALNASTAGAAAA